MRSKPDPNAPLVEETLLKKRRSLDDLQFRRQVTVKRQVKRKRVFRGEDVKIKRPEQFVREFRIKEGSQKKMERRAREAARRVKADVPRKELRTTVGVIVRIHGGRHSSDEIKKTLRDMGLNKKYDSIFVKLDEATLLKLKPLDAYIAYGYISNKHVWELMHARAHTIEKGVRMPLTENLTVEERLGDRDILCVNDMVHALYNVNENFEACTQFLAPFQLAAPVGHFEKKILDIHEDIESKGGFMTGDGMDELLNKIL